MISSSQRLRDPSRIIVYPSLLYVNPMMHNCGFERNPIENHLKPHFTLESWVAQANRKFLSRNRCQVMLFVIKYYCSDRISTTEYY